MALETMKRVRSNLELLVPRLARMGYAFGEGFFGGLGTHGAEHMANIAPILAPLDLHAESRVTDLEANVGSLPLSVRAFYLQVGAVNLVGKLPKWERLRPDGIENVSRFMQEHPGFDWRNYSLDRGLDPLFVWSLDAQFEMYEGVKDMTENYGGALLPYSLNIAPDYQSKYGVGGDGPYRVETPCWSADAPLKDEWHETTFVNYLRIALKWAGMPGLERATQPPYDDIAALTQGFLTL